MNPSRDAAKTSSDSNDMDRLSWLQWSYRDWSNWLEEKLEERRQVFLSDPDELIASFNREKSHAKEYHGRELLELIQNADDSGIGYAGPNKLLIRLTEEALFVANTGIPFSPEGIKSLMVSDNSPKQLIRTKCIGYKGLGFRSVLGWASAIVILSGKLSIGFSKELAADWFQKFRKGSPKVHNHRKVREFESLGISNPIPTLSVPHLLSSENIDDSKLEQLHEEGNRIMEEGYDTIVCILLQSADSVKVQVQNQVKGLRSEIPLFLQYLENVRIQSPERNEEWQVERRENEIIVNPQDQNSRHWKLYKKEGHIPKEYLRPDQILENRYEIKLAVPTDSTETHKLFVYFPTEVIFPFPMIVHATFEVGGNRQHLVRSDVNSLIALELADLMAQSAEEIKKDSDDPWRALRIISPRGDIDPILNTLDFAGNAQGKDFMEILTERAKEYALLPVRSNRFETPDNGKRIGGDFDNLLVGETFHDLCIHTDDPSLKEQLKNLGVSPIEYGDLRERISRISNQLSLEQRAELVYLLIENSLIEGLPPELLLDENGEEISADTALLPSEGRTFSLPSWVPQKIMNSELTSLLKEKFQVTRNRDLVLKLKPFNVQEYNMIALVSSIVAETNRMAKENPQKELDLRQQMVQAIWSLYLSTDEEIDIQDRVTVVLPSRNNEFRSSKELYLGKEYRDGRILEYLYAHIDPCLFAANPTELGFSEEAGEIEEFLCWLGVSRVPRYIAKDIEDSEFKDYVISSLEYPAKLEEYLVQSVEELKGYSSDLRGVQSVDRLEDVLETSDPHAILCWIATNPDVETWRMSGDENATFEIWPKHKQLGRGLENQSIPSYPLWLLRTRDWLPTSGGHEKSPSRCSLARSARDFSPIIGFPAVDMEHQLIKDLELDRTAIRNALTKIGVTTELDELPWDVFYDILLALPRVDQDGKKAKSLYRTLIARTDLDPPPSGERYKEFMAHGKMFGSLNGQADYYPIEKLYYLENLTLPDHIADQYPILELDRRRGASKVKRIFGVDQLTLDKIQVRISQVQEHPRSQDFQSEIDRLKPYIYALRVEGDTNRRELNLLKRLEVTLCKSVEGRILVDNEERRIELEEYHSINIDSKAYLVAEHSDYGSSLLEDELIADAIGVIVTSFLGAGDSSEIALLASCSIGKRDLLLNRITGGSGYERLRRTRELLETATDFDEELPRPVPWESPVPEAESDTETEPHEAESDLEKDLDRKDDVGSVSVTSQEKPPIPTSRRVLRRVKLNPKPRVPSSPKVKVNPDRAESLALRFEEEQGRFPKMISYFQGLEAFGCDILSFNTQSDMDSFKETGNTHLVERFIEVKGRSAEKGSITLKGNELNSAQDYRERFFLYRVYEDEGDGVFELVELHDPLASGKGTLDIQYEINPFRSRRSEFWEVREMLDDAISKD